MTDIQQIQQEKTMSGGSFLPYKGHISKSNWSSSYKVDK